MLPVKTDVLVLGAGIVGVSVALHLARRGRDVVLLDRQGAGEATSFGNAGLIQREGGAPHKFPQDLPTLLGYAQNRSIPMRFQWRALPRMARFLGHYWWQSRDASYRAIVAELSRLLTPGGVAILELGAGQEPAVADLARHAQLNVNGPARCDLSGHPRALVLAKGS